MRYLFLNRIFWHQLFLMKLILKKIGLLLLLNPKNYFPLAAEAITEHAACKTKPLQRLLMESKTAEKFRALLSTTPQSIQLKAKACYRLWFQNPDHPSLRFKKVHQTLPIYSVRIDLNWRSVGAIQ